MRNVQKAHGMRDNDESSIVVKNVTNVDILIVDIHNMVNYNEHQYN